MVAYAIDQRALDENVQVNEFEPTPPKREPYSREAGHMESLPMSNNDLNIIAHVERVLAYDEAPLKPTAAAAPFCYISLTPRRKMVLFAIAVAVTIFIFVLHYAL